MEPPIIDYHQPYRLDPNRTREKAEKAPEVSDLQQRKSSLCDGGDIKMSLRTSWREILRAAYQERPGHSCLSGTSICLAIPQGIGLWLQRITQESGFSPMEACSDQQTKWASRFDLMTTWTLEND